MLTNRLSKSIEIMESNKKVFLTFSGAHLLYGNRVKKYKRRKINVDNLLQKLLFKGNFITAPTITYRKEGFLLTGEFNSSLMAEDYDMLLRFTYNFKSYYIDEALCIYRISHSSLSNSIIYKQRIYKQFLEIKRKYFSVFSIEHKMQKKIEANDSYRAMKTYFYYNLKKSFHEEYKVWKSLEDKSVIKAFTVLNMRIVLKNTNLHYLVLMFSHLIKYKSLKKFREIIILKE